MKAFPTHWERKGGYLLSFQSGRVIAHQNNGIFKDIGYMLFDSYTTVVGHYFTMIDAVRCLTTSYVAGYELKSFIMVQIWKFFKQNK